MKGFLCDGWSFFCGAVAAVVRFVKASGDLVIWIGNLVLAILAIVGAWYLLTHGDFTSTLMYLLTHGTLPSAP
jgi:hypothetical protein